MSLDCFVLEKRAFLRVWNNREYRADFLRTLFESPFEPDQVLYYLQEKYGHFVRMEAEKYFKEYIEE